MSSLVYYFAYGHNTEKETMLKRVPEAKLVGTALLPKHRFVLREYADVVKDKKSNVLGVLWEMPKTSLSKLDRIEVLYSRKAVLVSFKGERVNAWVYFINRNRRTRATSSAYLKSLKRGYKENHIPQAQLTMRKSS